MPNTIVRLDEFQRAQRRMAISADDDVVMENDVDRPGGLGEALGRLYIAC